MSDLYVPLGAPVRTVPGADPYTLQSYKDSSITQSFDVGFYGEFNVEPYTAEDSFTVQESAVVVVLVTASDAASVSEQVSSAASIETVDVAAFAETVTLVSIRGFSDQFSVSETQSSTKSTFQSTSTDLSIIQETHSVAVVLEQSDLVTFVEQGYDLDTGDDIERVITEEITELQVDHTNTETYSATETYSLVLLQSDFVTLFESETLFVQHVTDDAVQFDELQLQSVDWVLQDQFNAADSATQYSLFTSRENMLSIEQELNVAAIQSSDGADFIEQSVVQLTSVDEATVTDLNGAVSIHWTDTDSAVFIEQEFIATIGQLSPDIDPYYPTVLHTRPQHYWRFGAVTGATFPDRIGGVDAQYFGTIDSTRGVVHGQNTAIVFDGQETVSAPGIQFAPKAALEFWVRNGDGVIAAKEQELYVSIEAGEIIFEAYDTTGDVAFRHVLPYEHKYYVWNLGEELSQVYGNGQLLEEVLAIGVTRPAALNAAPSNILFAQLYTGELDEVALYDRLLTEEEVQRHWSAGTKAQSYAAAVLNYNAMFYLPGYSIEDFNDEFVVLQSTGQVVQGPQKVLAGAIQGMIEYEPGALTDSFNQCSLSMWVRRDADGALTYPFTKGVPGDVTTGMHLRIQTTGNVLVNANGVQAAWSTQLQVNKWYHLVVVLGAGATQLYVDGVAQASRDSLTPVALGAESLKINYGEQVSTAEIFWTPRTLSAVQVRELYDISFFGRQDMAVTSVVAPRFSEAPTGIYVFNTQASGINV